MILMMLKHDTGFSQRIFQVSCVLILTCIPLRIVGHRIMEEQLLVFAIPASHLLLISHAASFRLTGPFVAMIRHMLLKDVTKFSMIYLLFLYAFSLPFHFLLQHQDAADGSSHLQSAISSFNKTNETAARSDQSMFDRNTLNSNNVWAYASGWMRLFKMTLGNHNQSQLRFARFGWLTIAMVVLFIILVPILLLNMLIAMMGNTYGKVIAKSEREWSRQWAKMLMQLERSLSTEEAIACIDAYSMILPKSMHRF